jgi:maltose/moltooligosaccharide transporter
MPGMILVAGIAMLLGAVAVGVIKEDQPQQDNAQK